MNDTNAWYTHGLSVVELLLLLLLRFVHAPLRLPFLGAALQGWRIRQSVTMLVLERRLSGARAQGGGRGTGSYLSPVCGLGALPVARPCHGSLDLVLQIIISASAASVYVRAGP